MKKPEVTDCDETENDLGVFVERAEAEQLRKFLNDKIKSSVLWEECITATQPLDLLRISKDAVSKEKLESLVNEFADGRNYTP